MKNRNIQEIRKALLIEPYDRRVYGKINVIQAPTNLGKTYSIFKNIIPHAIKKEGVKKIIVTCPDTAVHTQSMEAYETDVVNCGASLYTKDDMKRFLTADHPAVLLLSLAKTVHEQSGTPNTLIQLASQLGNKAMFIADEIHYGGTTAAEYYLDNTGGQPKPNSKYAFAKLLVKLSQHSRNILAYTATPLHEMFALLGVDVYGEEKGNYEILTDDKDWPKGDEFNLFNARLGGYEFVSDWIKNETIKEVGIINKLFDQPEFGLKQHWKTSEFYADRVKRCALNTEYENIINDILDYRTISHITVGSHFDTPSDNSADVDELLNVLQQALRKYPERYEGKRPIAVVTSGECRIFSIKNGDSKTFGKDMLNDLIEDESVGIEYIISIEMLKMGWNEKRISHSVQVRKRKQAKKDEFGRENPVTHQIIQSFSRGNRQNLGLKGINSIDELKLFILNMPTNLKIAILDYVKYINQQFGIFPNEILYTKGVEIYKEKYATEKPFTWGTCVVTDHKCDDPFCTINKE